MFGLWTAGAAVAATAALRCKKLRRFISGMDQIVATVPSRTCASLNKGGALPHASPQTIEWLV